MVFGVCNTRKREDGGEVFLIPLGCYIHQQTSTCRNIGFPALKLPLIPPQEVDRAPMPVVRVGGPSDAAHGGEGGRGEAHVGHAHGPATPARGR